MAKIQGHIERITFLSEENGFCVCKLKVKGEQNLVTIAGNMVNPVPQCRIIKPAYPVMPEA